MATRRSCSISGVGGGQAARRRSRYGDEAAGHPFSRSSRARTVMPVGLQPLGAWPGVSAAGPSAAERRGGHLRGCVVRLRKSMTESPEENRAVRAVGSTWFGPPM